MTELVRPAFDTLYLAKAIGTVYDTIGRAEIHGLSYFACLMAMYSGASANEWGYPFAATRSGAPYAEQLDLAIDSLLVGRRLEAFGGGSRVTSIGDADIAMFATFLSMRPRIRFLDAAIETTLTLPIPLALAALQREPQVRGATALRIRRELNDPGRTASLFDEFRAVRAVMDELGIEGALAPAALWLNYLSRGA